MNQTRTYCAGALLAYVASRIIDVVTRALYGRQDAVPG
jgi:hypothetical protein